MGRILSNNTSLTLVSYQIFFSIIKLDIIINQLVFVMVKCCVFFAVRTELLNIIQMSFGFKGLSRIYSLYLFPH
jgi:hypothetical protein